MLVVRESKARVAENKVIGKSDSHMCTASDFADLNCGRCSSREGALSVVIRRRRILMRFVCLSRVVIFATCSNVVAGLQGIRRKT